MAIRGKESVDFAYIGKTSGSNQNDYGVPANQWATNKPENAYFSTKYTPEELLVIVAYGLREVELHGLENLVGQYENAHIKTVMYRHDEAAQTYQVFVLHEKANKGDALRALADLYDVQLGECAVVGDGGNDMDMFRVSVAAGGLAMAMDNAQPDLKELATHILPRYDDDGAAVGLRHILYNFVS